LSLRSGGEVSVAIAIGGQGNAGNLRIRAIVNVAGLINQNLCRVGQGSEFILTGRGGLPSSPKDLLNAQPSWEDWRIISEQTDSQPINSRHSDSSNII
jgi:hypothetical protein